MRVLPDMEGVAAIPSTVERRIDYVPLDEIPRALRNQREHDLPAIRRSIERFGFATPGLRDGRTGRLIAGHGRAETLTAMRDDGADPPEGILTDSTGGWLVPIVVGWSSRSDAEADAMLIADNRLTEKGGWESRALAELLEEIADTDQDLLEVAGYTSAELGKLLAEITDGAEPPEDFPAYDETITTEHECPRCGYAWSGKSS